MSQPFDQGPRLSDPPSGDPTTQAVASLRGYVYQIYASGLAWLELGQGDQLYLEVAEDYAVAAQNALNVVQVRDTAANITIASEKVRDTLDRFVDLVARNPRHAVHLRYLTTSSVAQEQRLEHRINSGPSLAYWRRAALGADLQPLKDVLNRIDLSDRVRAFITERDDARLRAEFFSRIHWDAGQPPIEDMLGELEGGLLRYFVARFRSPGRPEQLAGAVVFALLKTVTAPGTRRVTDTDLLKLVGDTASVQVSRPDFEALIGALAAQHATGDASNYGRPTEDFQFFEHAADLPWPPLLADRPELTAQALSTARQSGVAFVTGSTGCGKTLVARLAARSAGRRWSILDLRHASAEDICLRLRAAQRLLSAKDCAGVILDDLNEIEDASVRRILTRFIAALRRRDLPCLVTAYRKPSSRALTELGLDETAHVPVPDLDQEEVTALVIAAGGDGTQWGRRAYIAGAFGHPQLVQAVIAGFRARHWPEEERAVTSALNRSQDVDAERVVARNRLFDELASETRALLYRVSLLFDRFDRPLALTMGSVTPVVPQPGAYLDQLIGPWVEEISHGDLRVSPLIENAGRDILAAEEVKRVHEAAALQILGARNLRIDRAGAGFVHALVAEQDYLLFKLAFNIIGAPSSTRRDLADWMMPLRLQDFTRSIFPANATTSVWLRFAQLLLIAERPSRNAIRTCWSVLLAELSAISDDEARLRLEQAMHATALLNQNLIARLPDPVALILHLIDLTQRIPDRRDMLAETASEANGITLSFLGALFIGFASQAPGVDALRTAFERLDATTPERRAALLDSLATLAGDYSLVVSHAWLAESRRENTDWRAHIESYRAMGDQAERWGKRDLALRAHVVRAIILDDYLHETEAAMATLEEVQRRFGPSPILARARAKIFYRRKDHAAALRLMRDNADSMEISDPVARTYLLREAGISAGELGEWGEARNWFRAAREAAASVQSVTVDLMAIGLRADEAMAAFKAGDVQAALAGLDTTLNELRSVDPTSSREAGYRHRVVGHLILWIFGESTAERVIVADEPARVVAGMCSNPDPPDLSDLPLGSPDYARYLLAQAEVASGAAAGIETGLRGALGGRAIPAVEIMLRGTRVRRFIRHYEAERLVRELPSWVGAQLYLSVNGAAVRSASPGNPTYGEIAPPTADELRDPKAKVFAEEALRSFAIYAAVSDQPGAVTNLCLQATGIPDGYAGQDILEIMATGIARDQRPESVVATHIHQIAYRPDLTPDDFFIAGLRFIEAVRVSSFQDILSPALETWARHRWGHIVQHQRFALRNPAISAPALEDALSSDATGLRFIAQVLLAADIAMKKRMGEEYRQMLRSL